MRIVAIFYDILTIVFMEQSMEMAPRPEHHPGVNDFAIIALFGLRTTIEE